ncbi:unnamed protein product [Closterium sp. NIES-53]
MIVYLTFFKNRQIACEFFTLLTVERCDAGSLFEVLLNHLRSAAVDVSKIVGISTDGASVMTGKENGLVARLREHVPHLFSCHCIAQREALAVKDAAESNEDLGMVDKVVRTVATLLGISSVWSQRFKYLQRVIYQTNLEVQGIHTVRWLSRGDAVRRLCKVLGACIVLLWEHNHKTYEIVTCYKFQFCLFFLADILADMNDLNRCFQRREEMAQPPPAVAGAGCASPLHRGVREGVLQAEHHQVLGAWSALQRASGGADADIAPEVRDRMAGGTGERERKGKQKEGEAVAAGTAGENEDEGEEEEEEEDDEVEQDLGDDQEVVEEEDNSFLSDDEDVEEVYFIDKPVH